MADSTKPTAESVPSAPKPTEANSSNAQQTTGQQEQQNQPKSLRKFVKNIINGARFVKDELDPLADFLIDPATGKPYSMDPNADPLDLFRRKLLSLPELKTALRERCLLLPWKFTRKEIIQMLKKYPVVLKPPVVAGPQGGKEINPLLKRLNMAGLMKPSSKGGNISNGGTATPAKKPMSPNDEPLPMLYAPTSSVPISMSFCLQLSKSAPIPFRPLHTIPFQQILGRADLVAIVDATHCSVWKGAELQSKFTVAIDDLMARNNVLNVMGNVERKMKKAGPSHPLEGLQKWIYVEKFKCFIILNTFMEIKFLNTKFELLSTVPIQAPMRNLYFIDITNELIISGVGFIKVFTVNKEVRGVEELYSLGAPRLTIDKAIEDEWIVHLDYWDDEKTLYAATSENIYVFDLTTGKLKNSLQNAHSSAITSMVFHQSLQSLITGCKDGKIKIWNNYQKLVWEFAEDDAAPVVSIVLIKNSGPFPTSLFLSASSDGRVSVWNGESGSLFYREEIEGEILDCQWIRKETFYIATASNLLTWTFNHSIARFSTIPATITDLSRNDNPITGKSKILALGSDCAVRGMSPLTGDTLFVALPPLEDTEIVQTYYYSPNEELFMLLATGRMVIFDTAINPCVIREEWFQREHEGTHIISFVVLPAPEIPEGPIFGTRVVVGGTSDGRLMYIKDGATTSQLVQAHGAEVSFLSRTPDGSKFFSFADDKLIKVWKLDLSYKSGVTPSLALTCIASLDWELSPVSHIKYMESLNSIVVVTVKKDITVWSLTTKKTKYLFSKDDGHTNTITGLDYLPQLQLVATSSIDKMIKIWDMNLTLVRELDFGKPVHSVAFANPRGDLLIGFQGEVSLIKMQDYLPPEVLTEAIKQTFDDDAIDVPVHFDDLVDFWELYYSTLPDTKNWHIDKRRLAQQGKGQNLIYNPQNPIPVDIKNYTLEERAQIRSRNENIRQYLMTERRAYRLEKRLFETDPDFLADRLNGQLPILDDGGQAQGKSLPFLETEAYRKGLIKWLLRQRQLARLQEMQRRAELDATQKAELEFLKDLMEKLEKEPNETEEVLFSHLAEMMETSTKAKVDYKKMFERPQKKNLLDITMQHQNQLIVAQEQQRRQEAGEQVNGGNVAMTEEEEFLMIEEAIRASFESEQTDEDTDEDGEEGDDDDDDEEEEEEEEEDEDENGQDKKKKKKSSINEGDDEVESTAGRNRKTTKKKKAKTDEERADEKMLAALRKRINKQWETTKKIVKMTEKEKDKPQKPQFERGNFVKPATSNDVIILRPEEVEVVARAAKNKMREQEQVKTARVLQQFNVMRAVGVKKPNAVLSDHVVEMIGAPVEDLEETSAKTRKRVKFTDNKMERVVFRMKTIGANTLDVSGSAVSPQQLAAEKAAAETLAKFKNILEQRRRKERIRLGLEKEETRASPPQSARSYKDRDASARSQSSRRTDISGGPSVTWSSKDSLQSEHDSEASGKTKSRQRRNTSANNKDIKMTELMTQEEFTKKLLLNAASANQQSNESMGELSDFLQTKSFSNGLTRSESFVAKSSPSKIIHEESVEEQPEMPIENVTMSFITKVASASADEAEKFDWDAFKRQKAEMKAQTEQFLAYQKKLREEEEKQDEKTRVAAERKRKIEEMIRIKKDKDAERVMRLQRAQDASTKKVVRPEPSKNLSLMLNQQNDIKEEEEEEEKPAPIPKKSEPEPVVVPKVSEFQELKDALEKIVEKPWFPKYKLTSGSTKLFKTANPLPPGVPAIGISCKQCLNEVIMMLLHTLSVSATTPPSTMEITNSNKQQLTSDEQKDIMNILYDLFLQFGGFFKDPFASIIFPQLDCLHAMHHVELRRHAAQIIPNYRISHEEIERRLIRCLHDSDLEVRNIAKTSLITTYSIVSRDQLRARMIALKLIPGQEVVGVRKDYLDELLEKKKDVSLAVAADKGSLLQNWMFEINNVNEKAMRIQRPPTVYSTMSFKKMD